MIGFIIGFVLGSWFGVMVTATLVMARDYDRQHGKEDKDG